MNKKILPSLSIFFPAYNEEENIAVSVQQAKAVAAQITNQYEIIIVDDGSSDKTAKIADQLANRDPKHVRVIHHRPNRGYGGAVLSGLKSSRYEYIFFTDADLQFNLEEIRKLASFVPEYEVVIGYRAPRQDPFMRKVNAWGWGKLNRWLFDLRVKDIDCAFKLFHRSVLHNISPQDKITLIETLKSQGAMLSAELLIRLQRSGITFKEVPVMHLPRKKGSPTGASPKVIIKAFRELIMIFSGELGEPLRRKFLRFSGVGVVNTLIDIGLYTLLTRFSLFFSTYLLVAKTLSFLAGSIFSFAVNRSWTFAVDGKVRLSEILRFYATVGSSVVVNVFSTFIFLSVFGLYDLWAVLLATGVTLVWNFAFMNKWVFKSIPLSKRSNHIPDDLIYNLKK